MTYDFVCRCCGTILLLVSLTAHAQHASDVIVVADGVELLEMVD